MVVTEEFIFIELIYRFVLRVCSENRLISLISRQHLHVVQLRAETRPNGLLSLPLRLQGGHGWNVGKLGNPGKRLRDFCVHRNDREIKFTSCLGSGDARRASEFPIFARWISCTASE